MAALEIQTLFSVPSGFIFSPCCQDADEVHQDTGPHHFSRLEAAGAVADGVGARGYRKHEGVTNTHLR